jgi:oligopeptide/dipeptide ABC transporter ATP-binding protein
MSFLFIAHDLKVACYFCDRIGVMYSGVLMEEAPAADLWRDGRHPYTQMLFASATGLKPRGLEAAANTKAPPPEEQDGAENTVPCCAFAPRCPRATSRCFNDPVPVTEVVPGHMVRCHLIK